MFVEFRPHGLQDDLAGLAPCHIPQAGDAAVRGAAGACVENLALDLDGVARINRAGETDVLEAEQGDKLKSVIGHDAPDAARVRQADGRTEHAHPRQDPFAERGRLHMLAVGMDRADRPVQVDQHTEVALADRPTDAGALLPIRDRVE